MFNQPPRGAAKKVYEVLGEIVWLMSQSPLHKQFFISGLKWFAMTPVLLQQFRMFYANEKPIGAVFWGAVSEEVEQRLAQGAGKLRPQDWKSGSRLWVVEVIAPFGKAGEMVQDLKAKVFPRSELKFLAVTAEGKQAGWRDRNRRNFRRRGGKGVPRSRLLPLLEFEKSVALGAGK